MPPIFDYKCTKCDKIEEHFVSSYKVVVPCGVCGTDMDKQISCHVSFDLKGDGFYKPGFNGHKAK